VKIEFCINDTWGCWHPVTGVIVDIAPHLAATFAVHRCPFNPRRWKVSDVETGHMVGQYTYGTRTMAIFKAQIFLRDQTQQSLDRAWKEAPAWTRSA
jgi:hypothetical protein